MDLTEYHKLQAKHFYANLREATAPVFFYWQDPDTPLPQIGGEPRGITGNCFESDNALQLAMASKAQGFQNPYWLVFDQVKAVGGSVRRGELGTKILARVGKEGAYKRVPITVFNGDQIKGVELPRPKGLTQEQQTTRQAGLDALIPPRKKTPTPAQYNARLQEVLTDKFPAHENPQEQARMTLRREYAAMTGQARLGLPREVAPTLAQDLKAYIEHRPHWREVKEAMNDAFKALDEVGIQAITFEQIPRKSLQQEVKPADSPKPKRERAQGKSKGMEKEQSNEIPF